MAILNQAAFPLADPFEIAGTAAPTRRHGLWQSADFDCESRQGQQLLFLPPSKAKFPMLSEAIRFGLAVPQAYRGYGVVRMLIWTFQTDFSDRPIKRDWNCGGRPEADAIKVGDGSWN